MIRTFKGNQIVHILTLLVTLKVFYSNGRICSLLGKLEILITLVQPDWCNTPQWWQARGDKAKNPGILFFQEAWLSAFLSARYHPRSRKSFDYLFEREVSHSLEICFLSLFFIDSSNSMNVTNFLHFKTFFLKNVLGMFSILNALLMYVSCVMICDSQTSKDDDVLCIDCF